MANGDPGHTYRSIVDRRSSPGQQEHQPEAVQCPGAQEADEEGHGLHPGHPIKKLFVNLT